ncbi:helix-turn-helix domain-containing protein [Demequina sediminicola]|uniref:helix-turn-helix domain-containing protein n=1 Tax=Demequina sediminicola TaxID=1095026 RepID=UPI0007846054|nr:helix-turn-helix domain-containing protein [Demequina sediminicola]
MVASEPVPVTFATPEESEALASVSRILHGHDLPALVGPNGEQTALPLNVFEILRDVVDAMQQGKGISVVPRDMIMTTQQAADFLGISRPTLVGLLEDGQIEYTKPGRHRRVRLADLDAFQHRQAVERREALDELTREASEGPAVTGFIQTR